jgi:hypothetical protein
MPSTFQNITFEPHNYVSLLVEECSLCYDSLFEPQHTGEHHTAVQVNTCGHRFHKDCITDWCKRSKNKDSCLCPLCNENINSEHPKYIDISRAFLELKQVMEELEREENQTNEPKMTTSTTAAIEPTVAKKKGKKENKGKKGRKENKNDEDEDALLNSAIENVKIEESQKKKNPQKIDSTVLEGTPPEELEKIDNHFKNIMARIKHAEIPRHKQLRLDASGFVLELMTDMYYILSNPNETDKEKKKAMTQLNELRKNISNISLDVMINGVMSRYRMYYPGLAYMDYSETPIVDPNEEETDENSPKFIKTQNIFRLKKDLLGSSQSKETRERAKKLLELSLSKPFYMNELIKLYLRIYEAEKANGLLGGKKMRSRKTAKKSKSQKHRTYKNRK